MENPIQLIEQGLKRKSTVDVRSGDTVRVHQKVLEAGKTRVQVFEGTVIRTKRMASSTANFTVRRIASGVGVEKTYLLHSPSVTKIEVTKRSKVRRNYLSYMRGLRGKGARLTGVKFDREAVGTIEDEAATTEETKIKEEQAKAHKEAEAAKAEEEAKREAKVKELLSKHEPTSTPEESLEPLKAEADKIEEQPKEKAAAQGPAEPQNKEK
ncbi:50S ribosomal protein L19 [Candidatus Saccharibacteria bacterium RIFCSPHIGHO2_12_FULL_47_16b]|nr:MAG: 50S ribosomal protein L19 [Candidatus Saccharibacteria bacterium RIFCSPHIGHO2_12_FULL_47_16b]OGL38756.1 MAG: 50S ribosomal protein L19 [Candidatus Saccharibacteria bacterium RIFCSPLOWO2_02_FULL_46_7]